MSIDNVPTASKEEAEAGVIDNKAMTPLRTKEAIDHQRPIASQSEAQAGTATKIIDAARMKADAQTAAYTPPWSSVTFTPPAGGTTVTAGPSIIANLREKARTLTPFDFDILSSTQINRIQTGQALDGAFSGMAPDVEKALAAVQEARTQNRGCYTIPPGRYPIRTFKFSGQSHEIECRGAIFYGVADSQQDAVITFEGFRHASVNRMTIMSDGNRSAGPIWAPNYTCAWRVTSPIANEPSQYVWWTEPSVWYLRRGLVYGAHVGEEATPRRAQSENVIVRYKQRGVQVPLSINGHSHILTSVGSMFTPNQYEANGAIWTEAETVNVRCDVGDFMSVGDEYQRSEDEGYQVYGQNICMSAPILENGQARFYVTGSMTVRDPLNGYSASNNPLFVVDPAAKGRLLLGGGTLRRPDGYAAWNRALLCDAKGNNDFRIDVQNMDVREWSFGVNNSSAHLIRGGQVSYKNVDITNSDNNGNKIAADSWTLNEDGPNIVTGVDNTGASMSATLDTSAKGGWSVTASAGGIGKVTADPPPGQTCFIRLLSVASSVMVGTPASPISSAFRVKGSKDYLLKMWLKRLGTTAGFAIQVAWYDYAGTIIGSAANVYAADGTRMDADGFDAWQRLRVPMKAPADAHYGRIVLIGSSSGADVGFNLIGMH